MNSTRKGKKSSALDRLLSHRWCTRSFALVCICVLSGRVLLCRCADRSVRRPRMFSVFGLLLAITAAFAVLSMVFFRRSRAEVPPRKDSRLVFVDEFDFIDESK